MTRGASMPQPRLTHLVTFVLGLIWLLQWSASARAQTSLKTIDNPGGGEVVYGPVDENTPPAAMIAVLRYVHTRFGQSPTVSKVFQSRDGQNSGAFFTVPATAQ